MSYLACPYSSVQGALQPLYVPPGRDKHCFEDGSYNSTLPEFYQSRTLANAVAPKIKALGNAQEFPSGKPKVLPCSCTYWGRMEG